MGWIRFLFLFGAAIFCAAWWSIGIFAAGAAIEAIASNAPNIRVGLVVRQ